jgi:hypothetical protein
MVGDNLRCLYAFAHNALLQLIGFATRQRAAGDDEVTARPGVGPGGHELQKKVGMLLGKFFQAHSGVSSGIGRR